MVGGGYWVDKLRQERLSSVEVIHEMLQAWEPGWREKEKLLRGEPKDWNALCHLDYQGGFEAMTQWFDKLVTDTPPTPDIDGLYFCLWPNPMPSPYSTVALFVAGSRDQGTNPDWHRDTYHWTPDDSVYNSPLLTSIYAAFVAPNEPSAFDARDMALRICWQWCGLVVTEWMGGPLRSKMLGVAPRRHIEVGFDFLIRFNFGDLTPENTPVA